PVRTIPNHGDRDPDDLSRRDGYLAGALRACCERSRAGKPLGSWGRGGVRLGRSPGASDKVTATEITAITAIAAPGEVHSATAPARPRPGRAAALHAEDA